MKSTLAKEGKFFVNQNGSLLAQNPQVRTPLSLSHIQRIRVEVLANTTTITVVTGMSQEEQSEMMGEMSVAWLMQHLTPKKSKVPDWAIDIEGDVYTLLTQKEVRGWWCNQHQQRDAEMIPLLCDYHGKAYAYARNHKQFNKRDAKRFAQDKTQEKYMKLHHMCMNPLFYHYYKLEDSYAKIW